MSKILSGSFAKRHTVVLSALRILKAWFSCRFHSTGHILMIACNRVSVYATMMAMVKVKRTVAFPLFLLECSLELVALWFHLWSEIWWHLFHTVAPYGAERHAYLYFSPYLHMHEWLFYYSSSTVLLFGYRPGVMWPFCNQILLAFVWLQMQTPTTVSSPL